MSENWRQSENALRLMINHKTAQPSINEMMGYFITNLSLNLLVKELLKSVNIWRNYGKMVDCVICPIHLRQITMREPHHSVLYRPDALPTAQLTVSEH